MRARGSQDLLGPSTKRAVRALLAGADLEQAGRHGTTNGAAMRITPVGIATPCADLASWWTGWWRPAWPRTTRASRWPVPPRSRPRSARASTAPRFPKPPGSRPPPRGAPPGAGTGWRPPTWRRASPGRPGWSPGLPVAEVIDQVYALVGTSLATQESVPAAFAVVAASPGDPWLACRIAASLGGDCDTIAAMAGAIAGACHGAEAFPASARSTIETVNDLGLDELARDLLRGAGRGGALAGSAGREG